MWVFVGFCWKNKRKASPLTDNFPLNSVIIKERKRGVVPISTLWELTDEKLEEAYQQATLLHLDDSFIEMLLEEMISRGLACSIQSYVS
ncbi:sporulation histidine kinase inhibitor Sda [Mesobacillus stamsii]|uniref:sporulation histidine kinase inhibitor Sda n=1 Tax=Mesobacillus stamsii TaxID=225347 RepID=UPI0009FD60F1|nr:sporulation histidine kinase inhibitor Sda [Mesobacillus stamsii]